ncbi:general stress protein CsbD [Methylobacterium sp. Leaf456]|uniref:CsbD family protein n=1 Tax=Methylobacterium sp. Leaf456 TaxID=1736382 RepID=UPI0006FD9362|nr:CsbD family protein [Methylobacterium sp. Leaf456]KQT57089.1 general stress protein CsbD [Methylobacterium sp. Leaf456]
MNRDHFRGASRHIKGRAQTTVGGLTGDPARQIRGAVNQIAGGAQYAYGRARDRAEDIADDGRHFVHAARDHADGLIDDGRRLARETARRGEILGRTALRRADANRTGNLLGLAALAFSAGWLARRAR